MPTVTREAIVAALRTALEPLPSVDALLESGAAAWGRVDAWSDIDLNVFVAEGKAADTFHAVESALRALSSIELTFVAHGPAEGGMEQKFYRLQDASPYLLVDLAVLMPSATEKFLEPEIHGKAVVYFDKTGVTKVPPLNREDFARKLRERLGRLRDYTEMFHVFVEKELNRGNRVEALDCYRAYVVNPLLEVLRMKHGPFHHSFRTRYAHYELPADVIRKFESLAFVGGSEEIRAKRDAALQWFRDLVTELSEVSDPLAGA